VVLAYNDLGMHCMNDDFSEIVILPPYNNVRAQVIKRGNGPDIVKGNDATVTLQVFSNTRSADKSNFWRFAPVAVGASLPADVGLTGNGLAGRMQARADGLYELSGIPITPIDDTGRFSPYGLATISAVSEDGASVGETYTVVPVSSEMSCNLCHQCEGVSTAMDILRDHDSLHGTDLQNQTPVLCASCHADIALGAPGQPGLPTLSGAMHTAHASRMDLVALDNSCYACHPGVRSQCQRDVHSANDVTCTDCHGGMLDVGSATRQPWMDEPRCGDCHTRAGFQFEEPGKLFKESVGHGGVHCAACHGSPHAITPATTLIDNQQAIHWQGHSGVINDCTVCHTQVPGDPFPHRRDD
jgi:hypothetical protein